MSWDVRLQDDTMDILRTTLVSSRGIWKRLAVFVLCLLVGLVGGATLAYLAPLYTAALIIALAGAVFVLRDTKWGFIATIAVICLLPFAAVPLDIGFEPTFLDLAILSVFFVWINRIAARKQGPFIATPLAVPILVFLMMIVVSMLASLGHSSLTTTFIRRFGEMILGILTYFAVVNCIRTPERLRLIVLTLIIAGTGAALIGIVFYFLPTHISASLLSMLRIVRYPSGPGVLRYVEDNPELPLRAISTSQDPNVLGGLLILVTGVTIPQIFSEKPLLPKKWLVPMVGVMFICLFLTYSRGAMAGLVAGVGVISVLRYRKLLLVLTILAALILILPPTQSYIQHFIEGVRGQDLATQMRFGEYQDAIKVIMNHPWLGVGFLSTPEIDLYVGVSSVYLLIGVATGLIGLTSFLVIMALFFFYMWQVRDQVRDDPEQNAIFWGIWCALFGALTTGWLDHYFFNIDFIHAVTLFWTYVGLGMVTWRLASGQEPAQA